MDSPGLLFIYSAAVIIRAALFYMHLKVLFNSMGYQNEFGVTEGARMLR